MKQTPGTKTPASGQHTALINKENLESSLLGIITARPLFSEAGDVVDFEYLSANLALLRTHGIHPDQIVGSTMLTAFPDLADHGTFPYYCEVARTGDPIVFESDFRSDELDIHVIVSISRPDPDYIVITFVEVSETIRITNALADLNNLSGTQIGLEDYIVGALEIGRRAVGASRAFQLTIHAASYSVVRQCGEDDFLSNAKPIPTVAIKALKEAGQATAIRNINTAFDLDEKSKNALPYQSFIGAPFFVDDHSTGAVIFCWTASRRREPTPTELKFVRTLAEAIASRIRLDAVTGALQQRNEDLERFASLVSHDLKAPLRSILILSDMLTDYLIDDEKAHELVKELQGNADQAQRMIRALRDFARLGTAGIQLESVDVKAAIEDCLHGLSSDIRATGAQIELSDLGHVRAERTLLSQVFSNLIANALKYAGNPDLRIYISNEVSAGPMQLICVTDNGEGVDARYAERIFELFRRVPGSEHKSEGDGVGLATCRKIVEGLGGRIWLDTAFDTGARFMLELPKAD